MGTEYGKDWRIHIGDGESSEAFDTLGGEGSFDFKRSSDSIDLSSKDDGVYKASGWGQQSISISVTGNVKLPDDGLEQAVDISKASPPEVNIKIMKGAIVKFAGRIGIGNLSITAAKDGPVGYSFDMSAVSAPTVDDLVATA
jgi:predicted secreted protein